MPCFRATSQQTLISGASVSLGLFGEDGRWLFAGDTGARYKEIAEYEKGFLHGRLSLVSQGWWTLSTVPDSGQGPFADTVCDR
jgi:hypothetical protein